MPNAQGPNAQWPDAPGPHVQGPHVQGATGDWLTDQRLVKAFARLQPHAFGASCGILGAVSLFLITAMLILKGPAAPDADVGPHLALLRFFIPGFAPSWGGAMLGVIFGFVGGYVLGLLFAGFLNFHHRTYLRIIERGVRRQGLLDG